MESQSVTYCPTEIWFLKHGHYWHVIVLFFLLSYHIYWCILLALPHLSACLEDIKFLKNYSGESSMWPFLCAYVVPCNTASPKSLAFTSPLESSLMYNLVIF